jgi:H+/Cl- antiporter ClcA/CBS domain-containing protein
MVRSISRKLRDAIPISISLGNISDGSQENGGFNVRRVFLLSVQAVLNAIVIGIIAKVLVGLIALITNLSFYGKFSFAESSPANNNLGWMVILVPVAGSIIVGVMARFGSAAIRGHGIPEAMEQILQNQSKINPVITFLKPLSAAISIGTGGPFGAEGPIIATGGAFGSVAGQIMRITPNERKIMLAAGATAGMAAIFGTPIAAVLLAIELLLFEFSPRSIIPLALACATGAAMHFALFGTEPVFAMPDIPEPSSIAMVTYIVLGILIGIAAVLTSKSIYWIEDLFEHLPIHWMWWPAVGAVAVGLVGFIAPHTLGVGYDNIGTLLTGNVPLQLVISLCFLKFLSWAISLGSGTSGGTLAPLLTIGGALGVLLGHFTMKWFPGSGVNLSTCALIGMAAMFAGASRALLTSILFALETTMQPHGMLPLLGACTAAYFVSYFLMKSTIMTEKIQRRGIHAPDSFEPDILQRIRTEQVMNPDPHILSVDNTVKEVREWIKSAISGEILATAFIVADEEGMFKGIVERENIFNKKFNDAAPISELVSNASHFVFPDSKLSLVVNIIDKQDLDILPVISNESKKIIGSISHREIFNAYSKRRAENEITGPSISLKYRSARLIVRGKQFYGK